MKEEHLVLYDYGQGGIWAFVLAESAENIENRFPEPQIFPQPPGWMDEAQLRSVRQNATINIDEERTGLLADIIASRSS
jgi:hypothetical protein